MSADEVVLVFNGVDGATGKYGLELTAQKLADHVLGTSRIPGPRLETVLVPGQKVLGAGEKVAAVVRFLVERGLEDKHGDEEWLDGWREELAKILASQLLGQKDPKAKEVQQIQNRLRIYPGYKLEQAVQLLVEGETEDLARWLLQDQDEEEGYAEALKEKLKRDARTRLNEVKRLLSSERAEELVDKVEAQEAWLEAFSVGLHLVPIQGLVAIKGLSKRPLTLLVNALESLSKTAGPPDPWLQGLLEALKGESKKIPWPELVEVLHDGLRQRIESGAEATPWVDLFATLWTWIDEVGKSVAVLGPVPGIDVKNLQATGWGIIFPWEPEPSKVPELEEQLEPLLNLRQEQAGSRFQVFKGGEGYCPNDTAETWLNREPRKARAADPANPAETGVPYYLLIVGSPEEIPFHFQYQLDVQYAVGRIHFDNLPDYHHYANSVVAAESADFEPRRTAAFFATAHPGDASTQNSAAKLVQPLRERIKERYGSQWQVGDPVLGGEAKKVRLTGLLGGKDSPGLLFVACHGMQYSKKEAERQEKYQGALLCQEWRGPEGKKGKVPRKAFVAADDLKGDARLAGMIAFFFACFSAGTPRYDEYYKLNFKARAQTIAEQAFVAALPKAMLSLAQGGALAVVGHVERALGASFLGPKESAQIAVFSSAVELLLEGHRLGWAMEYFNGRYAALSTELTQEIDGIESQGQPVRPLHLATLWAENNDARGYVVIGDPAVRLPGARTA